MTKGQKLLGGTLLQADIDEYDALEEICQNLTDKDGRTQYGLIKFIERKTAIIRKSIAVIQERNEANKRGLTPIFTSLFDGDTKQAEEHFSKFIKEKMDKIIKDLR